MKQRASNIELLRIVSMALIIGHHFAVHGGFYFHSREVTGNMLFLQLLSIGGKIGVNLFVLISGYFMVTSQSFRWQKAGKLWLQIFFYSVVIYAVCCFAGLAEFSLSGLGKACFPILSRQWWFASAYFVLYLLSPAINRGLAKVTQKRYRLILIFLTVFWCILPVFTWLPERLRDILWFVFLYCAAGYLRLYGGTDKAKRWLVFGGVSFGLTFAYAVVRLHFMARMMPTYETAYFQMYEPLILLTSLLLFRSFAGLEIGQNERINTLAALSFGVYLIHDSNYLRYPLWRDLANCASYAESSLLIPYALLVMTAVYGVCGGLEALRMRLFNCNLPYNKV